MSKHSRSGDCLYMDAKVVGTTVNPRMPLWPLQVVREGSKRVLNMRPFDVQLIGGMILHEGEIAEMRTGEGKTLVSVSMCCRHSCGCATDLHHNRYDGC
jgi:hypothetical protein